MMATLVCGVFLVVVGLVYGATMAPSPRDGVQPLAFFDEAFYSVLSSKLAHTGVESIYAPSGFDALPSLSPQTWYHWGEIWLASAAIRLSGLDPLLARHYVALPILVLAACGLLGTLVRRVAQTSSRTALLFGAACFLIFAPIPIPGTFFGAWARGGIFGVTMYGTAMVVILLAAYLVLRRRDLEGNDPSWVLFVGATIASILPLHIIIAILALVGALGAAITAVVLRWVEGVHSLPAVDAPDRRLILTTIAVTTITIACGLATGHGIGASGLSPTVAPFNEAWREAIAKTAAGSLLFFAILVAVWRDRRSRGPVFWTAIGVLSLIGFGALAWGARLGDFTMFHVFYAGIAVFATPIAAVAIWNLVHDFRVTGRRVAALAITLVAIGQLEMGSLTAVLRLQEFGPHDYYPVPISVLNSIKALPADAKVAYACRPQEEVAFWDPRLEAIAAHSGRPIMPMCFQAETFPAMTGTVVSRDTASPLFVHAPQRTLFPTAMSRPSADQTTDFLRLHGIDYIYADGQHPNTLVPQAVPLAAAGDAVLLQLP